MNPAILSIQFPNGRLPARGFRCPECGEEGLWLGESELLDRLARELGLYGVERTKRRTLQRTGNSITVSLDRELLDDVLGGAGPGDVVEVGRQGDHIVIRRERGEA